MPRSRFGRVKDGILVSGVTLNVHQKGKVFYVCNSTATAPNGIGGSDSNDGLTPERPLSTIDAAINKCTANRGDKIIVLPGHSESVTATSIVPDVAGIEIHGTGEGAVKPTLNFGATTSNIAITAANVTMKGLLLVATVDSVAAAITVSAAGCNLDLESADTSASVEFITVLKTASGCSNLTAKLKHRGFAAGDAMTRYVDLVATTDADIEMDFFGKASTSVVDMRTTACNNIQVTGRFYNESVALTKNVTNNTTSTWSVRGHDAKGGYDFVGSDDSAVAAISTAGPSTALGTDGTTVTDSATTVLGAIGADNANNAFASTSVVANVDGSVLERLEALMDPLAGYNPRLGFGVTKVSNLADGAGTDNLFTVTGRVLITSLTGEVTTVIGGAATLKLTDTTNSVDLCAATTIDTDAVGTMYALTSIAASILNGTGMTPVIGSIPNLTGSNHLDVRIVGDAQAPLTIAQVLDAADTGAITWRLTYIPLISGATVAAAA